MKKTTFLKATCIILLCGMSSYGYATDLYLTATCGNDMNNGTLGHPVATLSKALTIAQANDIIHVTGFIDISAEPNKAGVRTDISFFGSSIYEVGGVTYKTWNLGGNMGIITLNKPLTIIGDDKTTCGFDGKNITRLIRQDGSISGIITYKNLTFKNGNSAPNADKGGAIYIRSSKATFVNCEFANNTSGSTFKGGAVYFDNYNNTKTITSFTSCHFVGNFGKAGSALFATSGALDFDGCSFQNNSSNTNTTSDGGGAINIWMYGAVNLLVKNTVFENNTSTMNGGALFINDVPTKVANAKITFINCAFNKNTVTGPYVGGAAYFENKNVGVFDIAFINSTFSNNSVGGNNSGAICMNTAKTGSLFNLTNCTITDNKVAGDNGLAGAGIRFNNNPNTDICSMNAVKTIYNTIIDNNTALDWDKTASNKYADFVVVGDAYIKDVDLIIRNSFIAGTSNLNLKNDMGETNKINYAKDINNNLSPTSVVKLKPYNSVNHTYSLQPTSSAINFGDSNYLIKLNISTDQVGTSRLFKNNKCDTGAIEVSK